MARAQTTIAAQAGHRDPVPWSSRTPVGDGLKTLLRKRHPALLASLLPAIWGERTHY